MPRQSPRQSFELTTALNQQETVLITPYWEPVDNGVPHLRFEVEFANGEKGCYRGQTALNPTPSLVSRFEFLAKVTATAFTVLAACLVAEGYRQDVHDNGGDTDPDPDNAAYLANIIPLVAGVITISAGVLLACHEMIVAMVYGVVMARSRSSNAYAWEESAVVELEKGGERNIPVSLIRGFEQQIYYVSKQSYQPEGALAIWMHAPSSHYHRKPGQGVSGDQQQIELNLLSDPEPPAGLTTVLQGQTALKEKLQTLQAHLAQQQAMYPLASSLQGQLTALMAQAEAALSGDVTRGEQQAVHQQLMAFSEKLEGFIEQEMDQVTGVLDDVDLSRRSRQMTASILGGDSMIEQESVVAFGEGSVLSGHSHDSEGVQSAIRMSLTSSLSPRKSQRDSVLSRETLFSAGRRSAKVASLCRDVDVLQGNFQQQVQAFATETVTLQSELEGFVKQFHDLCGCVCNAGTTAQHHWLVQLKKHLSDCSQFTQQQLLHQHFGVTTRDEMAWLDQNPAPRLDANAHSAHGVINDTLALFFDQVVSDDEALLPSVLERFDAVTTRFHLVGNSLDQVSPDAIKQQFFDGESPLIVDRGQKQLFSEMSLSFKKACEQIKGKVGKLVVGRDIQQPEALNVLKAELAAIEGLFSRIVNVNKSLSTAGNGIKLCHGMVDGVLAEKIAEMSPSCSTSFNSSFTG